MAQSTAACIGSHIAAHSIGWTSVQNQMGGKPKCFARGTAIDEDGFATGQAREGFGIGALDLLAALVEARQQLGQVDIAMRGRAPVDMHNWHTESLPGPSANPSRPMFTTRGPVGKRRCMGSVTALSP